MNRATLRDEEKALEYIWSALMNAFTGKGRVERTPNEILRLEKDLQERVRRRPLSSPTTASAITA